MRAVPVGPSSEQAKQLLQHGGQRAMHALSRHAIDTDHNPKTAGP